MSSTPDAKETRIEQGDISTIITDCRNRDNSSDSRISQSRGGVGFVPYENLVGRADRVLLSSAGKSMFAFWTWRRDRFFEGIE